MNDERWETCLHEATHAVCATALGRTVNSVRVDASGGGSTNVPLGSGFADAVIRIAGGVGSSMLFADYRGPDVGLDRCSKGDLRLLRERFGTDNEADPAISDALKLARLIVEDNRSAIKTLARKLFRGGFVGAAALQEVDVYGPPVDCLQRSGGPGHLFLQKVAEARQTQFHQKIAEARRGIQRRRGGTVRAGSYA